MKTNPENNQPSPSMSKAQAAAMRAQCRHLARALQWRAHIAYPPPGDLYDQSGGFAHFDIPTKGFKKDGMVRLTIRRISKRFPRCKPPRDYYFNISYLWDKASVEQNMVAVADIIPALRAFIEDFGPLPPTSL